ncbi:MAG: hypothetical protein IJL53_11850 [Firmicutes bacterium]|nr:hypothetical protein [Bacillota bacterium]
MNTRIDRRLTGLESSARQPFLLLRDGTVLPGCGGKSAYYCYFYRQFGGKLLEKAGFYRRIPAFSGHISSGCYNNKPEQAGSNCIRGVYSCKPAVKYTIYEIFTATMSTRDMAQHKTVDE